MCSFPAQLVEEYKERGLQFTQNNAFCSYHPPHSFKVNQIAQFLFSKLVTSLEILTNYFEVTVQPSRNAFAFQKC